uniref:RRM domain-containing protein n=1 Tax=Strongyloides papillosus TaxID=174720 RepID=A0A0N5C1R8_STREA
MVKRARLSDIINNESNVERKGKIASLVPDFKDRCYYDAIFLKNLFSVINSVFIHVGVECLSEGEGKNLWCGYISFVTVKGLSVMDLK